MKDYTKYDFAAIVGAELEIRYRLDEEPLIAKLIHFDSETKIITLLAKKENDVPVGFIYVSEIISFTAKIKVEDMSVKQLKRLLGTYPAMGQEHIFVIAENGVHHSLLVTWEEIGKQDFTDYIDCTDWGWKHE